MLLVDSGSASQLVGIPVPFLSRKVQSPVDEAASDFSIEFRLTSLL